MKKKKNMPKSKKVAPKSAPKKATTSIKPVGDRIVVRALTDDELGTKTAQGIIIPETVDKERPEQGVVVAVGNGRVENGKRVPISVKVGDRIVFSKYGPDEVKIGGVEYLILKEDSVLAVIA